MLHNFKPMDLHTSVAVLAEQFSIYTENPLEVRRNFKLSCTDWRWKDLEIKKELLPKATHMQGDPDIWSQQFSSKVGHEGTRSASF